MNKLPENWKPAMDESITGVVEALSIRRGLIASSPVFYILSNGIKYSIATNKYLTQQAIMMRVGHGMTIRVTYKGKFFGSTLHIYELEVL
ncbi:MAG: hypothetical protein RIR39_997 [Pseudomonadota bacterium]|jgi:hypothetical protein